ncbi:unnamed protein product [Rotaria socialis]|uniref:Fatty acid desaturase domain-containing protein n=1 Tax=Rotaria socialis TaxID=392032 RepID=A0A821M2P4_9BILA|nr:unnamed protein product [Rotaria socialis]
MAANFPKQNRSIHILSASREICRTIKQSDAEIRQKYPFLYHQDVICAIIFAGSLLLITLFSYLYISSFISAIWTVMLIALVLSLLHELEHDIIHNLYFKSHRWIQNCMFIVIWVAKLHVSPWYRRQLHLKHHLLSGQINDAEERLIGLGLSPNYKRMAVSVHPFGGLLISDDINYDINTLIGFHTCYPIIRTLAVCLCFPNVLRQGCLVMMSNSSHYYGDIPLNTVYYQNQILDSWFLFPFQLFCFNFGATRIVHHYVPSQPFYIRHFTAKSVKHTMVKLGVRNNDFGFPLYILWDLMIFEKFNRNVIQFIREQLLKRNIKRRHTTTNNSELKTNEKVMDANGSTMNDDMQKLNAFVNQIALYDVSADQIEEVNTKAS